MIGRLIEGSYGTWLWRRLTGASQMKAFCVADARWLDISGGSGRRILQERERFKWFCPKSRAAAMSARRMQVLGSMTRPSQLTGKRTLLPHRHIDSYVCIEDEVRSWSDILVVYWMRRKVLYIFAPSISQQLTTAHCAHLATPHTSRDAT